MSRLDEPKSARQNGRYNCLHVFQSEALRLCPDARIPNMDQKGIFYKAFLADPSSIVGLYFTACALLSCPLGAVRKTGMQQWDPSNSVQIL